MPHATPNQENFNAGEVSPLIQGRVKSPRYGQGLARCFNYLPLLQGPLTRRPGSRYAATARDSGAINTPPTLIPFIFSETQAYMLEFGGAYVRFYYRNAPVLTTGTSHQVWGALIFGTQPQGTWNGAVVPPRTGYLFTATRPDINPRAQEVIDNFNQPPVTVANGSVLELITPYAEADTPNITWAQSADTLYLFHPNYPTYKLQRDAHTFWTLKALYTQDGPYIGLNSYKDLGDATGTTLATGTVSAGLVVLTAGPVLTISGCANNGAGLIRVTTTASHNYSTGQKVRISGVVGTTEANSTGVTGTSSPPSYWSVIAVSATTFDLIGTTFVHAYVSGGVSQPALFYDNDFSVGFNRSDDGRKIAIYQSAVRIFGNILNSVSHAGDVLMQIHPDSPTAASATISTEWSLGVYYAGNYPSCGCFHQSRLVLAGAPQAPQEIDASESGAFDSFAINDPANISVVTAVNALQFQLVSNDINLIRWLKSTTQGMLAGTFGGEWNISPSAQGEALTSTNFNATETSTFGTAAVDSVQLGNAVLYVQKAQRKVRELNFFFQVGTFRSTDLSEISEHITLPSITKLAIQKQPANITWGLRSDGQLVTLTYDRDDQNLRTGWAEHQLGGQSDAAGSPPVVSSIAVIPSADASYDELWMVVKRWVNGALVYYIEYLSRINDASVLQEDAFQGDCGVSFDSPLTVTAITNASPAVVTSAAHGLSNGDQIKINSVIGMNLTTTDVDGNQTRTNALNGKTFIIAHKTTDTFELNDFSANPVSTTAYSAYGSGGQVRKMVLTISGLTWLENETLGVLADGALHPDITVSNAGVATLAWRAAKVQLGYRYNSEGQQLRQDVGSATGSSVGMTKRVHKVALQLYRVGELSIGMKFTRLIPLAFMRADDQLADQPGPLFSGIHREGVESDYNSEGQFCFRQSSMLPGTILSITQMLDETDL